MKKVLSLVLASLMLVAVLAGCGSKDSTETPSESPSASPSASPVVSPSPEPPAAVVDYDEAIEAFKVEFDAIANGEVAVLVEKLPTLESEEEFVAWGEELVAVLDEIYATGELLDAIEAAVTEETEEQFYAIANAASDVFGVLANFEHAVGHISAGEVEEFEEEKEMFISDIEEAIAAWNAAIAE